MNSESTQQKEANQVSQAKKVFTPWQATTLIACTLISAEILTLPRIVATATKTDGMVAVFVAGFFTLFVIWMFTKLGQKFPNLTYVGYTQKLLAKRSNPRLGRILAFPFILSIALWWLLSVSFVLRVFGEAQRTIAFPNTPLWFMVGSMLVLCALVANNPAEVIARLNEFLLPLIVIPILLISLLVLRNIELTNLLPLFRTDWRSFFEGVIKAIYAFQGVSVTAIYMASYKQPEEAVRSHALGIAMVTFIYLFTTIACIGVFGHEEVKRMMWPTIELVKSTRMPGLILERMDSGFLAVWLVAIFTTVANFLATIVNLVGEYFAISQAKRFWIVAIVIVVIFFLAMWPEDIQRSFVAADRVGLFGFFYAIVIPPLLLLITVLRRRLGNGQQPQGKSKSEKR